MINLNSEILQSDEENSSRTKQYLYRPLDINELVYDGDVSSEQISDVIRELRDENYTEVLGFLHCSDEQAREEDVDLIVVTDSKLYYWLNDGDLAELSPNEAETVRLDVDEEEDYYDLRNDPIAYFNLYKPGGDIRDTDSEGNYPKQRSNTAPADWFLQILKKFLIDKLRLPREYIYDGPPGRYTITVDRKGLLRRKLTTQELLDKINEFSENNEIPFRVYPEIRAKNNQLQQLKEHTVDLRVPRLEA